MSFIEKYLESLEVGLHHIGGSSNELRERSVNLLNTGEGSRSGCLLTLSANQTGLATNAYFRRSNINEAKQGAYLAAKLAIMRQHLMPAADYLTEDLLWPLLSDNEEVIDWYRQNEAMYHPDKPSIVGGDKDNPKSWMYYRYQSWLALNARWDELGERCERILAMQDEIKKDRAYLIDHRFYLALAKGDKAAMESVLLEKCLPKNRRARFEQQSGLTRYFIDSYATLFAKLAWRNGYELEVDTPWIPKEWLPIQPNASYEDPWPFMQSFDIWQPFPEPYTAYSPKRSVA